MEEQFRKAHLSIEATPAPNLTEDKEVQLAKALLPMVVTPSGISMEVKEEHS